MHLLRVHAIQNAGDECVGGEERDGGRENSSPTKLQTVSWISWLVHSVGAGDVGALRRFFAVGTIRSSWLSEEMDIVSPRVTR
jgi:hypothetical protein